MNLKNIYSDQLRIKSYYKKNLDSSFSMWPHSHEYLEIMEVISGTVYLDIYINKELVETIKVQPNSIILITSSIFHRIRNVDDVVMTNLEFEPNTSTTSPFIKHVFYLKQDSEWNAIFNSKYGINIFSDTNNIKQSIESIINRIEKKGLIQSDVYIDSLIMHLLIKISECYKMFKLVLDGGTFYYYKSIDIIKRNIMNDISVKDLAKELNITPSYLERIFKEVSNITVKKYVNYLKLEIIKEQLINSYEPINVLFKKYGYKTMEQFIYQFKSVYNMTPKAYRNQHHLQVYSKSDFSNYNEKTFQDKNIK